MGSPAAAVAAGAPENMGARRRAPERWSARLSGAGDGPGPSTRRAGGPEPSTQRVGGPEPSTRRAGGPEPSTRRAGPDALERRRRAEERAREVEDSPAELRDKCRRLALALANAKHLVVYTGAGISTAADIPDYRGPRGVWTRLRAGQSLPVAQPARAAPTYTHRALTQLWARGLLRFVVSQNCDGLHVRSGLPRRALAELHGNMFAERCAACARVYLRAFDTSARTGRHAHGTRRLCHGCGAELQDTIVHFGERGAAAWPLNWAGALRHAAAADVVLCLGSSLKVLRRYPRLWRMHEPPHLRPRLYIVNLQWTPKDAAAELKINARCDTVMAAVARRLRLCVPAYCPRRDPLLWHAEPLAPQEAHTARGARLTPAAPSTPAAPAAAAPSPPPSDPEDDLPLCSLRRAAPPPPLQPPPPHPPHHTLHAFQVSLASGAATILLRAREPNLANGLNGVHGVNGVIGMLGVNGVNVVNGYHSARVSGGWQLGARLRRLLDAPRPPRPPRHPRHPPAAYHSAECEDVSEEMETKELSIEEVKREVKQESGEEAVKQEEVWEEWAARAWAGAIIARAVLLCREQLYPGLHTIVGAAAGGGRLGCSWCGRRCRWYGAPALTPPARRAAPAGRLCACCSDAATPGATPASPDAPSDAPGWFGKGYRKGRRKRS